MFILYCVYSIVVFIVSCYPTTTHRGRSHGQSTHLHGWMNTQCDLVALLGTVVIRGALGGGHGGGCSVGDDWGVQI